MIRSIYTANRHMNVLQTKQENTSANISNINTPGYKFQEIVQSTLESHQMINYSGGRRLNRRQELGEFVFGNQIDGFYRNFQQGNLSETNKATDFALVGSGFFTIQMDNGEIAYTRNGNFRLNENNQLETMEGHLVLGVDENGNIGLIYGENNSVDGGQLLITDFNDYNNLNNIGDTLFTSNEAGYRLMDGEVRQGFLEMSNVRIGDELVKLIELAREFESSQKLLHAADETLSKAVNEIGRV